MNRSGSDHGDLPTESPVGLTMMDAHPGIEDTPVFAELRRCMLERARGSTECEFAARDGLPAWFEFRLEPVPEGLLVLCSDITERKRNEAHSCHLSAVLRGIRNVNQLITRERDPRELLRKTCESLVEARSFECCCIVVHRSEVGRLIATAGTTAKANIVRRILERGGLPGCMAEALEQSHPVVRYSPMQACAGCEVPQECRENREAIAVRLENGGAIYGALLVSVPVGMASDPEELSLLAEVAGDVAFALRGIEQEAQHRAALQEIESAARFPRENPAPVLRFAADGTILYANQASSPLLAAWATSVGSRTPADVHRIVEDVMQSQTPTRIEVAVLDSIIALTVAPVADAGYVNAYGTDITERRRAEEHVRRYGRRVERLTKAVQDLSRAATNERIREVVRDAARELAGSDGATLVLREGGLCSYVDESAISPLWKGRRFPIEQCISGWVMLHGEAVVIEDIYADDRIPHDAYRPTFVRSLAMVPIRRESPIGAIGIYWARSYRATEEDLRIFQALADSTSVAMENVRSRQDLIESEARIRAIYDHLPSPTLVWQRTRETFVLSSINKAAASAPGVGDDSIGKPAMEFESCIPGLVADLDGCWHRREPIRREVDHGVVTGGVQRRSVATYGFIPPDMVLLHAQDVTDERRTEEQLRLAQRMEAVGLLAGGIAHDFNNLLLVILSCAGFAIEGLHENDAVREDIEKIRRSAERAAALTRQLLAFGRKQVLKPEVVDLNQAVGAMESMLCRLIGEDIVLAFALAPRLERVKADVAQLEQVVMNLVVNSRDAMPQGGRITIETANALLDDHYAEQHPGVKPGAYVMLSVTDTGAGIDEPTKSRIFEPFFTTKKVGKGTGLGLSTVYGIVKQSEGHISVYSECGKGTTFKIYLPRADPSGTSSQPPRTVSSPAAGTETILVVEDEEGVRGLLSRVLSSAGYRVIAAANGDDALVLGEQHEGPIHLLLTDVVMPRMSGRELATRLARVRPTLKVLYASGYTENAVVHHGVLDVGINFISKPFAATELTAKVREVLDLDVEAGQKSPDGAQDP